MSWHQNDEYVYHVHILFLVYLTLYNLPKDPNSSHVRWIGHKPIDRVSMLDGWEGPLVSNSSISPSIHIGRWWGDLVRNYNNYLKKLNFPHYHHNITRDTNNLNCGLESAIDFIEFKKALHSVNPSHKLRRFFATKPPKKGEKEKC